MTHGNRGIKALCEWRNFNFVNDEDLVTRMRHMATTTSGLAGACERFLSDERWFRNDWNDAFLFVWHRESEFFCGMRVAFSIWALTLCICSC